MRIIVTSLVFVLISTLTFSQTFETSNSLLNKSDDILNFRISMTTDNYPFAFNDNSNQNNRTYYGLRYMNTESSLLPTSKINFTEFNLENGYGTYSKNKNGGDKVGKFFLGVLVGGGTGVLLGLMATKSGTEGSLTPYIVGGALAGGIGFAFSF